MEDGVNDQQKSKDELIHKVQVLRQRVADLSHRLKNLSAWDEDLEAVGSVDLLMDRLPILIGYIDKDQRYLYVNQAYAAWYGKEKSYLSAARSPMFCRRMSTLMYSLTSSAC